MFDDSIQVTGQIVKTRALGFTLVEVMVAMTLGIILSLGMTTLAGNMSYSYSQLNSASEQLENGRYALQLLREDISHGGEFGSFKGYNSFGESGVTSLPNPCSTSATDLSSGMSIPIQGYKSNADLSCISNYKYGTDILVVRRASSTPVAVATLTTSDTNIYMQAFFLNKNIGPGSGQAGVFALKYDGTDASVNNLAIPVRKYIVDIYYIASCNVCSGTADTTPTLKRLELVNGSFQTVALVEGIENMQLEYGIGSDTEGYPASYKADETTIALKDWFNVLSVQVNLMARNKEKTAGYTDTKRYKLGTVSYDSQNDAYKRHVFSSTVRVVTLSDRREST